MNKDIIPTNIEFKDYAPIFVRIKDAEVFLKIISEHIKAIQTHESIRLIVLETWLLLDYLIRHLILVGLDIAKYETEDFDLKTSLLPRGFRNCLNLLVKIRDHNKKLPEKPPEGPDQMSVGFLSYLHEKNGDFLKRYSKLATEYSHEKGIPVSVKPSIKDGYDGHRFVEKDWLKVVDIIDEKWVKKANRINVARNLAAHSHDDKLVAKKLGFSGTSVLTKVKKHCLGLIEELLGIVATEEDL